MRSLLVELLLLSSSYSSPLVDDTQCGEDEPVNCKICHKDSKDVSNVSAFLLPIFGLLRSFLPSFYPLPLQDLAGQPRLSSSLAGKLADNLSDFACLLIVLRPPLFLVSWCDPLPVLPAGPNVGYYTSVAVPISHPSRCVLISFCSHTFAARRWFNCNGRDCDFFDTSELSSFNFASDWAGDSRYPGYWVESLGMYFVFAVIFACGSCCCCTSICCGRWCCSYCRGRNRSLPNALCSGLPCPL